MTDRLYRITCQVCSRQHLFREDELEWDEDGLAPVVIDAGLPSEHAMRIKRAPLR